MSSTPQMSAQTEVVLLSNMYCCCCVRQHTRIADYTTPTELFAGCGQPSTLSAWVRVLVGPAGQFGGLR